MESVSRIDQINEEGMQIQEQLQLLEKKHVLEVRCFANPPQIVLHVMAIIMMILGKEPTWASAKKEMARHDFIDDIIGFDRDSITLKSLVKIQKFTVGEDLTQEKVMKVSSFIGLFARWVLYLQAYTEYKIEQSQPED